MNRSIGVFDSGVGGVSVLAECMKLMPSESFLYYADYANAPYGDKPKTEIIALVDKVMEDYFVKADVKAVVIACNTATSAAIDYIRDKYDMPIVGIEPAVKPALLDSSDTGNVLIMATESTVSSDKFINNVEKYDRGNSIICGCPGLMEVIESCNESKVQEYLNSRLSGYSNIKSVVLGCTHYPFAKKHIKSVLDSNIVFYNGAEGVARQLVRVLSDKGLLLNDLSLPCSIAIDNSSCTEYNKQIYERIQSYCAELDSI